VKLRIECTGTKAMTLGDLVRFQGGLKTLPEENYQAFKAQLLKLGFSSPFHLWQAPDQAWKLVDGHQRLTTLTRMAEEGVEMPDAFPAVEVFAADEQQAKQKVLALASQYGKIDGEGLRLFALEAGLSKLEIKSEFRLLDVDLKALDTPPAAGNADPDDVPEKPEPRCQPGELWQLGSHRLLVGDSTKPEDVDRLMAGEKADCVWTDPPYNVALGMETPEEAAARNRRTDGLVVMNDKMSDGDFRAFLTTVFTNMARVMRPGAAFYVAHADSEGYNFRGGLRDAGLLMKQCLIWVKSSLVMGRQDYQWRHEPIAYGWLPGGAHSWHSDRKQSTVLEFDKPSRNGEHPTMKPVELVAYCIQNSTAPGEIVLDLFGGSGTTMIASEQLGRRARLIELDPHYASVIVARFEQFTGQKAEKLA